MDASFCRRCGYVLEHLPGAPGQCQHCGFRPGAASRRPRRGSAPRPAPAAAAMTAPAGDISQMGMVRRRMEGIFLFFVLGILVLALRLTFLQWFQGGAFASMADRMQTRVLEVDASRGHIRDRNGNDLAMDGTSKALAINPRLVSDPAATVARLSELMKLTPEEAQQMQERIARGREKRSAYCRLRRGVDRKLAETVLKLSRSKKEPLLDGLTVEESPMRVNPSGADALQLLGPVNVDGRGVEGLEMFLDPILRGRNGERRVRVSATGEPIPSTETRVKEPQDGGDIRLALDRDIQHFVEAELRKATDEQNPDAATAIVMDVQTGGVLAMANYPNYAAGQKQISSDARRNRAITDLFEPGSIFKVLTAAAALENGVPCNFYCGGSRTIGNRTIHCAHGERHGAVDMRKMIEQSCNIAAGGLAERLGPERMHEFLTRMGLQSKTGIEFPGEEYARLPKPENWRTMRTVNIGFGQGVVVTPIQLISAYAAIANDGMYNPPQLVLDAPGSHLPKREPRRVMTVENARKLRTYMESVVNSGTGKAAKVAGYSAAGKTGTAQIAKHGSYKGNGYVASFAGCIPASKPRLAILVSVWHPRKGEYGGTVSAPVFREIARQCVQFLRIPPDQPGDMRDGARPASMMAKNAGKLVKHND